MKKINVTDLNEYLFCSRKLWLRMIKGFRGMLTLPMVKGKFKHQIIEHFSNSEENIVSGILSSVSELEVIELYRKNCRLLCQRIFSENFNMVRAFKIDEENFWNDFWKDFEPEIELRAKIIFEFLSKNIFGESLWQILEPKYKTELKISSEKLGLAGRIDRLEIWKDEIIPFELKNKKADSKPYDSDVVQLVAYALLLEDNYSCNIRKGFIQYKDKKVDLAISDELKKDVLVLIDEVKRIDEQSCPPIQENFKKCETCNLKEVCFKFIE